MAACYWVAKQLTGGNIIYDKLLHTVGFTNSDRYKCLENLKKGAVDLCLTYCGWENCDPGHRFGPNKRISHVLHIVESGTGVFEMDGQQF